MNATVNASGRAFELDFAKALAIVFMVLVHCFETSPIGQSEAYPVFGTVVEFLGVATCGGGLYVLYGGRYGLYAA